MCNLKAKKEVKVATSNDKQKLLDLTSKDLPKLELEYPCSWCYKVIANSEEDANVAVKDVILEKLHTLKPSNKSKSGKFVSMNLDLIVENEEERDFIFKALKEHEKTKMVL